MLSSEYPVTVVRVKLTYESDENNEKHTQQNTPQLGEGREKIYNYMYVMCIWLEEAKKL